MTLKLQAHLLDHLSPLAADAVASDVRIGLGYTAVRLAGGAAGVAWTPTSDAPCCTHLPSAGTLAGQPAAQLLGLLADGKSALGRAVGLATANALLASSPVPGRLKEDVLDVVGITPGDHVAMVGYFGPVVASLRKLGCRLDIVELREDRPGTLNPDQGREALAACSVAILTATSLVNGTCDDLLASLGSPRAAILLGPSSPMCPGAFAGTKLTHIGGARVLEPEPVLRIVSEGGGTMLLKKHMVFETVPIPG